MKKDFFYKLFEANFQLQKKANNLRRWTQFFSDGKYDEIAKQAMNCLVAFVLAILVEQKKPIRWELFPKIAIYRAFQKVFLVFDTPEKTLKDICENDGLSFDYKFSTATDDVIEEMTSKEVREFVCEGIGTEEERIYKAATKIATLLELKGIQLDINGNYQQTCNEIKDGMQKYMDIPGFSELADENGAYFKEVFPAFANLRNQVRWAECSYNVECSVLGHLFDTAVFAYIMALEKDLSQKEATKCFFMGIFHDVPETFTKDIPSPVKERIKGFREATEKFELKMMEEKVYPHIKHKTVEKGLRNIMFEDEANEQYKKLMKGADYMSAASELTRQFIAGSMDDEFMSAMETIRKMFKDCQRTELTPGARKLFKKMYKFAKRLRVKKI